ncbi:hypothetical protein EJ05DRAFT_114358 [Pseudovirgaria hyperparasitica]|uniref:Uncharacterized protein n=1 Tax=Pseudovirgaria hyperparasitica TaxID=470096 RepID=A0A6A6VZS4_9PEZI|nr:uncharacterized protein EJ05DRAFT_114358 [Pseudovirgaria hyperparasitica]KAF2755755.1 hypothetical protein EJ05DRAFT_114358 [Pseudovirgaria hyperparasitica]
MADAGPSSRGDENPATDKTPSSAAARKPSIALDQSKLKQTPSLKPSTASKVENVPPRRPGIATAAAKRPTTTSTATSGTTSRLTASTTKPLTSTTTSRPSTTSSLSKPPTRPPPGSYVRRSTKSTADNDTASVTSGDEKRSTISAGTSAAKKMSTVGVASTRSSPSKPGIAADRRSTITPASNRLLDLQRAQRPGLQPHRSLALGSPRVLRQLLPPRPSL